MQHPLAPYLQHAVGHLRQARDDLDTAVDLLNCFTDLLNAQHRRTEALKCQIGSTTQPSPMTAKPFESCELPPTNPW